MKFSSIILMIFILTTSLERLFFHMPEYAALLHQRIDALGAVLGNNRRILKKLFHSGDSSTG